MASIQQGPNGPVLVLKESALQQKGKDAQQNNIAAAKLVAQLVRSSLGPRGLDKMLVDSLVTLQMMVPQFYFAAAILCALFKN